jgi:hypothetical protein
MLRWKRSRLIWVALGLLGGLLIGGVLPHSPLHAVATDRADTFAICTAPVDEDVEAIYFLDFLTGELKAAVLSPQLGKFAALYQTNLIQAMGIDATKNPRYLLVSGIANLRRGTARPRFSQGLVYVAEVNSGRIAVFAIPWAREAINAGKPVSGQLIYLDAWQCRTAAIRPTAPPE